MKNNKHKNPPAGQIRPQRVHFEFSYLAAESVFIAGTFNDWQPSTIPMITMGQGRWAEDPVLPPGNYECRLVVDGRWRPASPAPETVPNPFGGLNSIRRAGNGA